MSSMPCMRGFVHVSDGTAVLARTDLVVDASLPIVFRRAYHSARTTSSDFGAAGWHLTVAERIERHKAGRLDYIYGNGTTLELDRKGRIRSALQAYLSDVSDVRVIGDAAIEVSTRAGLIKRFGRAGDSYRLASVEDTYGNRLELRYSPHGGLQRVDSSSGAWIVVTRDGKERIKSILDSHGRSVRYEYDSNGRLATVTDPGEHDWHYGYDAANRLVSTTTPNDFNDVEFRYGAAGRVAMSRAHGVRNAFEYRGTKTIVTDSKELATRYSAGPSGLTTEVTNPLGTTTSIRLARSGLPIALVRNEMRIAEFSIEQSGRRAEGHARFVSPASSAPVVATAYRSIRSRAPNRRSSVHPPTRLPRQ